MSKKIELKMNTPFGGRKINDIVEVEADTRGVPLDGYWRKRLKDAKRDNCVEIVKKKKGSSK